MLFKWFSYSNVILTLPTPMIKNPKGLSFMSFTRAQNFWRCFFRNFTHYCAIVHKRCWIIASLANFFRNLMNTKMKKFEKTLGQEPLPFLWFFNVWCMSLWILNRKSHARIGTTLKKKKSCRGPQGKQVFNLTMILYPLIAYLWGNFGFVW